MQIPFFDLNYGAEEEEAVVETLRSKWISAGPKCESLEEKFAQLHNVSHAVSLSSCTAALHLALRVLGIGPGDEVIVPSLTFVATASSVRMVGAMPVFADIESAAHDWTMSPEDVRKKITSRTKAIIPMHYGGYGANMPAISAIADEHRLKVVEDACHAPMGTRDDQVLGSFGDAACYSFYTNKNIASGEGGMLLTNDEELAQRVRLLRSHGMTATAYDREQGKEFYEVLEYGYNYRLDDIRASLALVQLEKLPDSLEKRQRLVDRYRRNLQDAEHVTIPFGDYSGRASNYIFGVLTDCTDRAGLRKQLKQRGVATSMHYPPAHQFACYESVAEPLPKTEEVGRRELSLPLWDTMTFEQVDYVCKQLLECLRHQ